MGSCHSRINLCIVGPVVLVVHDKLTATVALSGGGGGGGGGTFLLPPPANPDKAVEFLHVLFTTE